MKPQWKDSLFNMLFLVLNFLFGAPCRLLSRCTGISSYYHITRSILLMPGMLWLKRKAHASNNIWWGDLKLKRNFSGSDCSNVFPNFGLLDRVSSATLLAMPPVGTARIHNRSIDRASLNRYLIMAIHTSNRSIQFLFQFVHTTTYVYI